MTAVHRIKRPKPEPVAAMPDEAMTHLFGPLIVAIQEEAKNAVAAAMNIERKAKPIAVSAKT
jgi:hypothetical protein